MELGASLVSRALFFCFVALLWSLFFVFLTKRTTDEAMDSIAEAFLLPRFSALATSANIYRLKYVASSSNFEVPFRQSMNEGTKREEAERKESDQRKTASTKREDREREGEGEESKRKSEEDGSEKRGEKMEEEETETKHMKEQQRLEVVAPSIEIVAVVIDQELIVHATATTPTARLERQKEGEEEGKGKGEDEKKKKGNKAKKHDGKRKENENSDNFLTKTKISRFSVRLDRLLKAAEGPLEWSHGSILSCLCEVEKKTAFHVLFKLFAPEQYVAVS